MDARVNNLPSYSDMLQPSDTDKNDSNSNARIKANHNNNNYDNNDSDDDNTETTMIVLLAVVNITITMKTIKDSIDKDTNKMRTCHNQNDINLLSVPEGGTQEACKHQQLLLLVLRPVVQQRQNVRCRHLRSWRVPWLGKSPLLCCSKPEG